MGTISEHTLPLANYTDRLDVMNFLNEVVGLYPQAISFASGRPLEDFFDFSKWNDYVNHFACHHAKNLDVSVEKSIKLIGQYGKTQGIINDLIAQHLDKDEDIQVDPENIIVTDGAQEAMTLSLLTMFNKDKDVLLIGNPTYIGMTGIASILDIETMSVEYDDFGPRIDAIQARVEQARQVGKKVKGFYVIADFDNPSGKCVSLERRMELLECCAEKQITIFEDNPYGLFYFEEKLPTIKSLDKWDIVTYFGTFSKTICPALRVGFVVTKQKVKKDNGDQYSITEGYEKIKSFVTLNTGQFNQAVVGGVLLECGGSLKRYLSAMVETYKHNRDVMLSSLEAELGDLKKQGVLSWNTPSGGFFITLSLPFSFKESQLVECAEQFGVIGVPTAFFSDNDQHDKQLRLSYSYVKPQEIKHGVSQLAKFIHKYSAT
ncbi:MAG: PLP-dependent aminotransferase family protein [Ketobacter sp.]|nr:MAG: PLP-dependent aminotransferase family protein [Ketobacter sp.]